MWHTFDCVLPFHRCSGFCVFFFCLTCDRPIQWPHCSSIPINKLAFTHGMWSACARSERFTTACSFRKPAIAHKKTGKISPEKSIGLSRWAWHFNSQDTCRHFFFFLHRVGVSFQWGVAVRERGFQTITRSTIELDVPLVYAFNCSVMHCWSRRRAVLFESNRGQCWAAVCSCGKHL